MRVTYLRIEWLLVPDAWFRGRIARGMNSTLGFLAAAEAGPDGQAT